MKKTIALVPLLLALVNFCFSQQSPTPKPTLQETQKILINSNGQQLVVDGKQGVVTVTQLADGQTIYESSPSQTIATNAEDEIMDVIIEFQDLPLAAKKVKNQVAGKSEYADRFSMLERDIQAIHSRMGMNGKDHGKPKKTYYKTFHGVYTQISKKTYAAVQALSYVKAIYRNEEVKAVLDQSVPLIGADKVWTQLGAKGEGMVVGIIDTGIDYRHPDLGNGFGPSYKVIGGYDFVNEDADPIDDNNHGTHCAGIVAADGLLKGVAPKAKLIALKVLNASGSGNWDDILAAIEWVSDPNNDDNFSDHLNIVSMSLGGPGNANDPLSTAVDNAVSLGTTFCIAAGNSGNYNTIGSPGTARSAITVGATDMTDLIASFSSKGPNTIIGAIKPEVVAPGVDINSTITNGGYASYNGTSMATPHVAGLVALLKQLHPTWTSEQMKSALVTTAKVLPSQSVFAQGGGRIQSLEAAKATSFAVPSLLSFGAIDASQSVYTASKTITVTNTHSTGQTYHLSFGTPISGITFTNMNGFSLSPGQSKTVTITMSVDNAVVPYKSSAPFAYEGFIAINGTKDVMHLPWAFIKAAQLHLVFDKPFPYFWMANETNSITGSTAAYATDGLSADVFVYPGTYDVVVYYSDGATYIKYVVRESVAVSGSQTLSIPSTLATNKITSAPVNQNGTSFTPTGGGLWLTFPTNSRINGTGNLIIGHVSDLSFSNFTNRFSLLLADMRVNPQESNFYSIQYPLVNGLSNSRTLTVSPSDYVGRDVDLYLSTESTSRYLNTYIQLVSKSNGSSTGTWSVWDCGSMSVWTGKIFATPDTHPTKQFALALQHIDGQNNTHFSTSCFSPESGKLGSHNLTPTRPDIFMAGEGQRLTFGRGLILPQKTWWGINTWDVEFYGQLEDWRPILKSQATYELYNSAGTLLSSGPLTSLSSSAIQPTYNKIVYKTNYKLTNTVTGQSALTKVFDNSVMPNLTPEITSLQIRNHLDFPASVIENGAMNAVRFSIDDQQLVQSSVKLFLKAGGTTTWLEIPYVLIAETPTYSMEPCGKLYKANLGKLPFAVGNVDLKVAAANLKGNSIELILTSAFVLEDNLLEQTITFTPLPTTVGVCAGTIGLSASSSAGLNYPITFESSNPAVVQILGNVAQIVGAGTVTITAKQAGDNVYSAAATEQTITISPLPAPTISGNSSICNTFPTLTSSFSSGNVWSTNEITSSIVAKSDGSYTVTVTDAYGCKGTSSPFLVTDNRPATPEITPSGNPFALCTNGVSNKTLSTVSTADTYSWEYATISLTPTFSVESSNSSIDPTKTGLYRVTITSLTTGCKSAPSIIKTVYTFTPAQPTIVGPSTVADGQTVELTSPNPDNLPYQYKWYAGKTNLISTMPWVNVGIGTYYVSRYEITGISPDMLIGCWINSTIKKITVCTAPCYVARVAADREDDKEEEVITLTFGAYPNPAHHKITISLDEAVKTPSSMTIRDLGGKVVGQLVFEVNEQAKTIDVGSLPSGMYVLSVINSGVLIHQKIIIQH